MHDDGDMNDLFPIAATVLRPTHWILLPYMSQPADSFEWKEGQNKVPCNLDTNTIQSRDACVRLLAFQARAMRTVLKRGVDPI